VSYGRAGSSPALGTNYYVMFMLNNKRQLLGSSIIDE